MQSISWDWQMNGSSIASGSGNYTFLPLQLPLLGFGDYQMFVIYGNAGCNAESSLLQISNKDLCDCDSIAVSYKRNLILEDCHLFYDIDVTVCNNSKIKEFCPDELVPLAQLDENISIIGTDFPPNAIPPSNCDTFHIRIEVLNLEPSAANFIIRDNRCAYCEKEFSIDLMPDIIECETGMSLDDLEIRPDLSSSVAVYFDFHMNVNPCQKVLSFWTEPPMVVDYWYDESDVVQGLGMVDYATLTQLMAEGREICFYAITCEGDQLCKRMFCIPAEELYNILLGMGVDPPQIDDGTSGNEGNGAKQMTNPETGNLTAPRLMPNPTTGEVNVIGTADEVVEVLVMDMNGRRMATFENTSNFNISTLSSGPYIVRVKTHHADETHNASPRAPQELVTYLKLVKK